MRSVLSAVVVAFVVSGCSETASPNIIAGTWLQDFGKIPGNFFQMNLSATSSGVSGTGYGCGEAGPCATSNISGTIDGRSVHLTIITTQSVPPGVAQPAFTSKFDGFLMPGNVLAGKLRSVDEVGLVYDVTYHRGTPQGTVQVD